MNSAPAQEQQVHSKQSPRGDANVIKPYKTAKSSTQRSFLPFTGLFAREKKWKSPSVAWISWPWSREAQISISPRQLLVVGSGTALNLPKPLSLAFLSVTRVKTSLRGNGRGRDDTEKYSCLPDMQKVFRKDLSPVLEHRDLSPGTVYLCS